MFNTVIDYDEMFVEQQASTEAPPVDETDIPDTILMAAEPISDYDEDEEELEEPVTKPKKEKKSKKSKNGEVITYKASTPPKPAPAPIKSAAYVEPEKPKPVAPVKPAFDESSVNVGTKVFHKAFGHGVVQTFGNGRLSVVFGDVVKPFMYPAAFLQGFLKIEE
ncbi:MAG: hypothetical protein J5916_04495 [Oscillospiraceae bacterium]|nr:hypothetical protein [Oscillospiraceae bacterium]